jgi:hypothetical protein
MVRRAVYFDGLNRCRLAISRLECPRFLDAQSIVAALVFAVGITALLMDFLAVPQAGLPDMHLIFGLAMLVAITGSLAQKLHTLGRTHNSEFCLYARELSRRVYLLLYGLAAVRLGLYLYEALAAASDARMLDPVTRVRSMDDFQIYILYGVAPLWVIRSIFLRLATHHGR